MKTWKSIFLPALCAALCVGSVCAGERSREEKLVGEWKDQDGIAVVFYANGRMKMVHPTEKIASGNTVWGHWRLSKNDRITIKLEFATRKVEQSGLLVFIGEDEAEIRGDDEAVSRMKRIK